MSQQRQNSSENEMEFMRTALISNTKFEKFVQTPNEWILFVYLHSVDVH